VFARQRRTFSQTTVVDAPVQKVWDVLADWKAMNWLVTGSVLAVPVPASPAGLGALTCCWQRSSDGSLKAGVFEIVEFEPGNSIVFLERQRPVANSRMEFHLEARGDQTAVQITLSESMYRYEWGMRGSGATEWYLNRLTEGLEVALADEVPGPHGVETLVLQNNASTVEAVHEVEIAASADAIWRLVEDEDGSLLAHPALVKQWFADHDGRELQVQLIGFPDGGMTCVFQQILRPEPFRTIVRGVASESDHQLLPGQNAALLRATYRWDPNAMSAQTIAAAAQRWLGAVKAAAEGDGPPAS
jgi:uncharacterized protein YndB with AHSA1/START domain